jgi:RNase P/RNase MRP subunit POP5
MCGFCIQVKFYGEESDVIIIRAAKETVKEVWTALSLITSIGNNTVVINVIHVFGTRSSLGSK